MRDRLIVGGFAILGLAIPVTAATQTPPDRSAPPKLAPPRDLKLPPIVKRTLSNGMPVWIVEQHEVPVASVSLVIRSGATADPAGKFGLASLTAAMLDEGAGTRDALALADAIDFLGASIGTGAGFDAGSVSLYTPVARLGDALALMADVAIRPTFASNELERLRKERLTSLLQIKDNPPAIGATAFPRLIYGDTHRYGTGLAGTAASVGAFTAADLRAFHRQHYQPSNAHLIVAGDVQPDAALAMLEKSFGSWAGSGAAAARSAAMLGTPEPRARTVFLIDKPGAAQSVIRIGWTGVPRSTPDYYAIQVLNTILGGSFTSRLNTNLRETHGYAYGAGSGFDMRLGAGPFVATANVQTDKTSESLTEFFKELANIGKPVSAEELEKAKNYLALGYPQDFETSQDIASKLTELVIYSLPEGTFTEYVSKVQAVTAADVERVAKKYVAPERFAVVVVGDLKTIDAGIRKLNLGTVRVVPIDEILK
ncbi:MAG: pitrilysin family protein [Vicinamibacterales bacterium]